jgi:hypothetical protein
MRWFSNIHQALARARRGRRPGPRHRQPRGPRPSPRPGTRFEPTGGWTIGYHGTPSAANAKSILSAGWLVGGGNARGDGVYFATTPAGAKAYAGSSGVYIKCRIRPGRTCVWSAGLRAAYRSWCRRASVAPDGSAECAFLLQKGFNSVRDNSVVVILAPQFRNAGAWKRKHPRIRVLSVHRASDDARVRV